MGNRRSWVLHDCLEEVQIKPESWPIDQGAGMVSGTLSGWGLLIAFGGN